MYSVNKVLYTLVIGFFAYVMPNFAQRDKLISVQDFRENMQHLWADHGIWTHEYIVAALADIPNVNLIAQRLLKNQEDIGDAVVPYYGKDAGKQLADLLKDHILIAVDLVSAAKSGDKDKQAQANAKWHKNAQDIAVFLDKANPYWPKDSILEMLNQHLKLTADQAVARLAKDWAKDINLYDQIRDQLQMMANDLSTGIIKQFPDKFR